MGILTFSGHAMILNMRLQMAPVLYPCVRTLSWPDEDCVDSARH